MQSFQEEAEPRALGGDEGAAMSSPSQVNGGPRRRIRSASIRRACERLISARLVISWVLCRDKPQRERPILSPLLLREDDSDDCPCISRRRAAILRMS